MHQPCIFRNLTLPVGAVRLWVAVERDTFTDANAPDGAVFGFPTNAERLRVKLQVTGGSCWMTQHKTAAAVGYGWLLADGTIIEVGVPFHQLSFIKAASAPIVQMVLRGDTT
jgi:hypothetical protein